MQAAKFQPPKKRRVALYARISTADQKNGLDAQIRALKIYCDQNKIENYEIFADENQSGTKASRPGLDRMVRMDQCMPLSLSFVRKKS